MYELPIDEFRNTTTALTKLLCTAGLQISLGLKVVDPEIYTSLNQVNQIWDFRFSLNQT